MKPDELKAERYWIHDDRGSIIKETSHGGFAWHKGKEWIFHPDFLDITFGKELDWSPLVNESDSLRRISLIEDGKR